MTSKMIIWLFNIWEFEGCLLLTERFVHYVIYRFAPNVLPYRYSFLRSSVSEIAQNVPNLLPLIFSYARRCRLCRIEFRWQFLLSLLLRSLRAWIINSIFYGFYDVWILFNVHSRFFHAIRLLSKLIPSPKYKHSFQYFWKFTNFDEI